MLVQVSKLTPPESYVCACLQGDVLRGDVAQNVATFERLLRIARESGARLAVLPEMWSTSFAREFDQDLIDAAREADRRLAALSAELDLMVVGSALEAADGKLYNRATLFDQGRILATYRKIHLFSPNAENRQMAAGHQPVVVETRLGRLGLIVCYDIRFGELTRWYFYHGADLLIVPAQWPEARASHWRALVDARAVENQCFVVACNRTGSEGSLKTADQLLFPGNSRVVDPMGEVLASGRGEEAPILASIELRKVRAMRRTMPIEKDRRPALYRDLWAAPWSPPARRHTAPPS